MSNIRLERTLPTKTPYTFREVRIIDKPGFYKGRHFSTYAGEIVDLKRTKQLERAEELLIHLVDATEEMSRATGMGVAPWYYRQLAIIYHSQMDYTAEIARRGLSTPAALGTVRGRTASRRERGTYSESSR
jgi:hypothetical protein